MKEYIFARHGIPKYLLSDEGSEFLNQLVEDVCKLYGVTKVFFAAYHSRGHGMVERLNRTVENRLKHTTNQVVMIGTYGYREHYSQFGKPLRPVQK
jgi:transposase InsO family protein